MQVTIVGVKKTEYQKDGRKQNAYNYCGIKSFTQYERENADCEGEDVIKEFSRTDFNIHPGDTVEFIYEPGFQDRATLVDVRVLSIAEQPPFDDKKDKHPEKAAVK